MIKKLGKRKITTMILAGFMSLLTLIGGAGFVPRPAKAATAETNAITSADDFKDISEYTRKPFEYGADISGKLIYWYSRNCSPTSSDLGGFSLGTTSNISMRTVDGSLIYEFGGQMSLDDENLMMTKCVQNDAGGDIGVMIYCPGDVVTFKDGAYSFDPSTGFTADGSTLTQGVCCYLAELVERTDTSKYVENDYTLGETIPAGTIVRFKTSEVAKSGNIQFLKGDKEIFINLYTEEIAFWGSNVDLMETLDGALVVNRGETFVDVYFENEITIEMIQTEGYTVHTLTAPSTSGGNGSHISGGSSISVDKTIKKMQDLSPAELIGLIAIIALELIGAATYILKAPNSKYKWIILIGLLIISAGLDIWTYLRFTGII